MKVKSSKPKGRRIFKSYRRPYWIEPVEFDWWFSIEKIRTKWEVVETPIFSQDDNLIKDLI